MQGHKHYFVLGEVVARTYLVDITKSRVNALPILPEEISEPTIREKGNCPLIDLTPVFYRALRYNKQELSLHSSIL